MKEKRESLFSRDMLADLSDSRSFLMGVAILWIVLCHGRAYFPESRNTAEEFLNYLVSIGYGGCDIFLLLSGFGLAYSLKRDDHYGRYLGRRARKLFPAYYPFILVYMGAVAVLRGISAKEILGNLTFVGFWFSWKNQFNWYIQAVMVFYLAAPLVYRILKTWKKWAAMIILGTAALGLQVVFFGKYQMIAIARIPVFLLGMLLGCREKGSMYWTKGRLGCVLAVFVVGVCFRRAVEPHITWGNGLHWYPFLLLAPSGCFLAAGLRPFWLRFSLFRAIDDMVCLCGRCSYEIYLVHLLFFETLLVGREEDLLWKSMLIAGPVLGIGYHYVVDAVMRKVTIKKIHS